MLGYRAGVVCPCGGPGNVRRVATGLAELSATLVLVLDGISLSCTEAKGVVTV